MAPSIEQTRRLAKSAARRRAAGRLLRLLGPWLCVGFGVGLALVALDRFFGPGLPGWALLLAPVGVGAIVAIALALRAGLNELSAAAELDRTLGLRDRLSSALELARQNGSDPFVSLAAADAEGTASPARERLREALPLRLDNTWVVWPLIGALGVAAVMFLPAYRAASREAAAAEEARLAADRERAREDIERVRANVRETLAPGVEDAETNEQLEVLERLSEQLSAQQKDADTARAEAASTLEEASERLEREAEQTERRLDAVQERFRGLSPLERSAPSAPLNEALRRGDLESAKEAARDLEQRLDEMSAEERTRLAEDLERLAEQIDASGATPQSREEAAERLMEQGFTPEQAESMLEEQEPAALREQLENQGLDRETADRMADQLARENEQRAAEEEAQREAEELKQALEEAAKDVRERPQPPQPQEPPSSQGQESQDRQPQQQEEGARQQGQESPGGQQSPQQTPGEGATQPQESPGQQQPQPGGQETDRGGEKSPTERQQEGGPREDSQSQPVGERPGPTTGEQQSNQREPSPD
ncbi:MAG: hypothetical protein VYC34_00265, partial [Planctomycetota bacterium]|nr:hypothetical protein [Planctomycetota bacterium]